MSKSIWDWNGLSWRQGAPNATMPDLPTFQTPKGLPNLWPPSQRDTLTTLRTKPMFLWYCTISICGTLWMSFSFLILHRYFCRILGLTCSVIQWDWTSFEVMNMSVQQTQYCFHCCTPLFFNWERIPWSFKPWTSSTELYCMSISTEIVHLSMMENWTK